MSRAVKSGAGGLFGVSFTRYATITAMSAVAGWVVAPLPLAFLDIPVVVWTAAVIWIGAMLVLRYEYRPGRIIGTGLRFLAGCAVVRPLLAAVPAATATTGATHILAVMETLFVDQTVGIVLALVLVGLGKVVSSRRNRRLGTGPSAAGDGRRLDGRSSGESIHPGFAFHTRAGRNHEGGRYS